MNAALQDGFIPGMLLNGYHLAYLAGRLPCTSLQNAVLFTTYRCSCTSAAKGMVSELINQARQCLTVAHPHRRVAWGIQLQLQQVDLLPAAAAAALLLLVCLLQVICFVPVSM